MEAYIVFRGSDEIKDGNSSKLKQGNQSDM